MKKQQTSSFAVRHLSRNEMKDLKGGGGAVTAYDKVWVCINDGVTCYAVKYDCYAACISPWNCVLFNNGCPYE
jgi:hypothetical protein